MDSSIALILLQDGIVNGAIYALLGMALVLVFAVTRVIFIPQGEFVAFGALTLAMLVDGRIPGTVYLLALLGGLAFLFELLRAARTGVWSSLPKCLAGYIVLPLLLLWIATSYAAPGNSLWLNMLLTLVLVIPMGPMVYRIVYQPWPRPAYWSCSSRPWPCTSLSWAWPWCSSAPKAGARPPS